MPIYEYQCQVCGERHEALQKFSDGPLRKCPACGKLKLKRMVSAAAFHLKGSGWYVTDFRDKGKPKKEEKEATGKESKAAVGDKPESKDATSKDAKKDSGKEPKPKPAASTGT